MADTVHSIKPCWTSLTWDDKRRQSAHQDMQNNKMNIIQHTAKAFYRKYSDVTPFVIIGNCNLITHSFSVTVTDYSYIYFVIKLHNIVTCN